MWELWMHLNYDLLYIPLTSKYGNFQLQIIIFCKKRLLLCESRFLKKNIIFSGLRPCYHRQAKRKKIYFATKKILQNFEGHDHWHCQYIAFKSFKFFQSGWDNVVEGIWCYQQGISYPYIALDYQTLPPFVNIMQSFISMQNT